VSAPARTAAPARLQPDRVTVYVWELPVRLAHWGMVLAIFVLAATGFYLGGPFVSVPGEARDHFFTGTVKAVHLYAGIALVLALVSRMFWLFTGNRFARLPQFIPVSGERRRSFVETIKFYLFLRLREPDNVGHNPVAGLAYLIVWGLCLVSIATGLALYGSSAAVDSPLRAFAGLAGVLGGLQTTRWIHHAIMWLLLGFMMHHVASALLVSSMDRNGLMGSIFSGYKFVKRDQAEREAGDGR
jgi:Ni/Fe-hydrogenase 1 B-type cytochrome subunit